MRRGQVIVEFALVLTLFLFIVLEGLQLSFIFIATSRLEHAVMEGAIAGASDPDPPQRCDIAEDTMLRVLDRTVDTFRCTGIGELLTITATRTIETISPFHGDATVIEVTESAAIRK